MYETDLSAIDIRGNYLYNVIVYIYVMGFLCPAALSFLTLLAKSAIKYIRTLRPKASAENTFLTADDTGDRLITPVRSLPVNNVQRL